MKKIIEIRNELAPETLIIGNGDVVDLEDAKRKIKETGCDGVMLGRAIFGNPFLFTNRNVLSDVEGHKFTSSQPSPGEEKGLNSSSPLEERIEVRLRVMLEHTKLFEKMLGGNPLRQGFGGSSKNFAVMKKHFKAYVNGFDGAKELRMKLMETNKATEVENIVNDFLTCLR